MTDDQIIEAAIQGHASTREAIRWAIGQVREQANTHQLPSVSEQNTHKPDALVRQLVDAIEPLAHLDLKAGQLEKYDDDLTVYQRDNTKITIGDIRRAQAALAAAKEAGL